MQYRLNFTTTTADRMRYRKIRRFTFLCYMIILLATITFSGKSFLNNVKSKGSYLKNKLLKIARKNESVTTVLGTGLMIGVRFKDDPAAIISSCRKKGLLVIKAGNNTVRFMPPLTVARKEIDSAVAIFNKVLKE